jgi:hypothetical protein
VNGIEAVRNRSRCSQRNCGGGRKSKVESATAKRPSNSTFGPAQPHTQLSPCCSQGYAHCPRALYQPLPPSRLLSRLFACRHPPSTPPTSVCAMPRTRPREQPTLQRTARERDWVLRRVEVCDDSLASYTTHHTTLFSLTLAPLHHPPIQPTHQQEPH